MSLIKQTDPGILIVTFPEFFNHKYPGFDMYFVTDRHLQSTRSFIHYVDVFTFLFIKETNCQNQIMII